LLFLFFSYTSFVRFWAHCFFTDASRSFFNINLHFAHMDLSLIQTIQEDFITDERPEIRTGMEVEVHQKIKEETKNGSRNSVDLLLGLTGKQNSKKRLSFARMLMELVLKKLSQFILQEFRKSRFFVLSKFVGKISLLFENSEGRLLVWKKSKNNISKWKIFPNIWEDFLSLLPLLQKGE